jgi:hypothetical protein
MPGRDLPDLEERLRRLPALLAVEAPAGLAERVAGRGRRRRWARRAAAAVAAALLAGAVATRSAVLDHTPAPVLNPGPRAGNATPGQLARGQWQALPSLPPGRLARRDDAAVVWTGRELIVWGGLGYHPFRTFADGAAYDPRTGRWALLPPAPEGQWLEGDNGLAVWTGREVLVWGGVTIPDPVGAPNRGRPADGVAYDPARRTWRRLPAAPAGLRPDLGDRWAVWTGRELLVGDVQEADAGGGTVAAADDPAADRWRPIPPSPRLSGGNGHLRARTAMWAGTRLLVWNLWSRSARAANDESSASDRLDVEPDGIDLWAYDPGADRWTVLPVPPGQLRRAVAGSSMAWTGREVVVAAPRTERVGGQDRTTTVAGRYDLDRAAWTPIAPPPRPRARIDLTWTGAALVVPYDDAVYDPATDAWVRLPAEPEAAGAPPRRSWGASTRCCGSSCAPTAPSRSTCWCRRGAEPRRARPLRGFLWNPDAGAGVPGTPTVPVARGGRDAPDGQAWRRPGRGGRAAGRRRLAAAGPP